MEIVVHETITPVLNALISRLTDGFDDEIKQAVDEQREVPIVPLATVALQKKYRKDLKLDRAWLGEIDNPEEDLDLMPRFKEEDTESIQDSNIIVKEIDSQIESELDTIIKTTDK